ncbi:NAD-dependent epimerase/dehydratase family protein [Pseudomonas sp. GL-B-19]|uniref:NAD-dependent epimerase/dehydratase family protein n=1 Tax=Pseudomonas sp. GL-B-19 TaxID=2832393 RepID=UPI001CC1B0A7|nr:NAD(P)-dependent oxidoreductase [Pseudomonas sp. GL-B-19]
MNSVKNDSGPGVNGVMQRLVVIGGTGFVGHHLLKALSDTSNAFEIIFAVHRNEPAWLADSSIHVQRFDVESSASLAVILTPGCIVLNLLRPDGSGWFLPAIESVLRACRTACVKRYIHVSSIDVFGASQDSVCTSASPIVPMTPYEREHAAAEALVRAEAAEHFEVLVLRLGAVFGVGGLNIVSFVKEVSSAPHWKLALRRSLYGARRMHLVSVEKVVEVLLFITTVETIVQGEIIVVTEDSAPDNNFAYLQDCLMKAFGRSVFSRIPCLPPSILRYVLDVRKVSNSDPMRRFRDTRLSELGFLDCAQFTTRLDSYVKYLRANA